MRLLSDNFDKILLAVLFTLAGFVIVMLAHWNVSSEIVIRIEDAFSGILGALIALMTGKRDNNYGAVLTREDK